jgi:hypothetical protein
MSQTQFYIGMGTFEDLLDLAGPSFDNPQWIQLSPFPAAWWRCRPT